MENINYIWQDEFSAVRASDTFFLFFYGNYKPRPIRAMRQPQFKCNYARNASQRVASVWLQRHLKCNQRPACMTRMCHCQQPREHLSWPERLSHNSLFISESLRKIDRFVVACGIRLAIREEWFVGSYRNRDSEGRENWKKLWGVENNILL